MDDLELLSNSNPILNIPITTYTDNKTQESLPLLGFLVQHLIATPSSWCLILSFQRVSWRKKGHQSKVTATVSPLHQVWAMRPLFPSRVLFIRPTASHVTRELREWPFLCPEGDLQIH